MPRRAEAIERQVDEIDERALIDANQRAANASPSEPPSTSAAAASDVSGGERLYVGMTEEGLSGDCRMTMQRDRHGRWVSTRWEERMTIEKAREPRRNFHVGESKEHETSSIASAEASPLQGRIPSQPSECRRGLVETSVCRGSATLFWRAGETEWQGVLDFKAVDPSWTLRRRS